MTSTFLWINKFSGRAISQIFISEDILIEIGHCEAFPVIDEMGFAGNGYVYLNDEV